MNNDITNTNNNTNDSTAFQNNKNLMNNDITNNNTNDGTAATTAATSVVCSMAMGCIGSVLTRKVLPPPPGGVRASLAREVGSKGCPVKMASTCCTHIYKKTNKRNKFEEKINNNKTKTTPGRRQIKMKEKDENMQTVRRPFASDQSHPEGDKPK
jgi:hypothetical protein